MLNKDVPFVAVFLRKVTRITAKGEHAISHALYGLRQEGLKPIKQNRCIHDARF